MYYSLYPLSAIARGPVLIPSSGPVIFEINCTGDDPVSGREMIQKFSNKPQLKSLRNFRKKIDKSSDWYNGQEINFHLSKRINL